MQSSRPTLSGPLHVLMHVLIIGAGWLIFGWSWWTVGFGQPFHPTVLATLIVITLILAPLITVFWVEHNRDIYSRKGQRRIGQRTHEVYQQDWTGRLVHAQFDTLRDSRMVMINSTQHDKYFMAEAHSPRPNETSDVAHT